MMPLKVLITNHALANYAGSELYARDVALHLKNRGHAPVMYSQILGRLAAGLKAAGITVVHDLRQLDFVPDIIHGQHNLEVMTALCHFPNSPAIFVCHGYRPWQEHPPRFPRIYRYVAVDQACWDRLLENGIPRDRAEILLNFVDLKRFRPRKSLPPSPRRALIFSNSLNEQTGLPVILKACRSAGIEGRVAGLRSGFPCFEPENLLPEYDLVFAKARAALEALAVGCAVITCDSTGLGSMVSSQNYESLRLLNFGFRTLTRPLTVDGVLREIQKYDPDDAQRVSQKVRQEADMEKSVDQLIACYRSVIEEFQETRPSREAEEKALAAYFDWLGREIKGLGRKTASVQSHLAPASSPLGGTRGVFQKMWNRVALRARRWLDAKHCRRAGWNIEGS